MTPARTGGDKGHFEFDRRFPGIGRVRQTSGTSVLREFRARDALLTKLFTTSQHDLLRAFRDGLVTIGQLVEHDRHSLGGESLAMVRLAAPLWETIERTLPLMGRAKGTRERYALSFKQLRARAATWLGARATVADLGRVDWLALSRAWPGNGADWNRMRTAVSRLLSLVSGDKYSAARRGIVAKIPELAEPEGRTPDLTPEQFVALRDAIEDADVRAALTAVVITGWRIGEYLSLDKSCLQPGHHRVRVPSQEGNKTRGRVTAVDPELWPWIAVAVPFAGLPVPKVARRMSHDPRWRRLWKHWRAAQEAQGMVDGSGKVLITLHDLKHCAGQWASDRGISDRAVQQLLGHKTPAMTARYTKQTDARRASAAVGQALKLVGGTR